MTRILATPAALRRRSDENAPTVPLQRRSPGKTGFTLIEVLVALAIIAMMAAVVVPGLARRLDVAFNQADLQQVQASAWLLPARVVTLGIDLTLDTAALTRALPDGLPPLDIPRDWVATVETPAKFWHAGTCEVGSVVMREPVNGRRWRFGIARLTCELSIVELTETGS